MVTHGEGGISQPEMLFPRGIVADTPARVATFSFTRRASGLLRVRGITAYSASAVQGQCRARALAFVLVHSDWPLLRELPPRGRLRLAWACRHAPGGNILRGPFRPCIHLMGLSLYLRHLPQTHYKIRPLVRSTSMCNRVI